MKPPRKQCAKYPWRVDVDPNEIPGEYCVERHRGLASTIAEPGVLRLGDGLRMMACHETAVGKELPCVGWISNQIGEGNNLALRLAVATGRVDGNVITIGEQHPRLEDTLPKTPRTKARP